MGIAAAGSSGNLGDPAISTAVNCGEAGGRVRKHPGPVASVGRPGGAKGRRNRGTALAKETKPGGRDGQEVLASG